MVFVGFSPEDWAHRAIVRGLTGGQPLTEDSLAVLLPSADALHRRYWTWERGPAGTRGVRQVAHQDLEAAIRFYRETLEKHGHSFEGREIPVARLLALADSEAEATNSFTGKNFAGFIQKPYRPTELLEKVREVLESERAEP